jgi:hypothetical protein
MLLSFCQLCNALVVKLQENVGDSLKKGNKWPHETCDKQAQGSRDNAETRSSLPLVIFFPTQNPISLQVVSVLF